MNKVVSATVHSFNPKKLKPLFECLVIRLSVRYSTAVSMHAAIRGMNAGRLLKYISLLLIHLSTMFLGSEEEKTCFRTSDKDGKYPNVPSLSDVHNVFNKLRT